MLKLSLVQMMPSSDLKQNVATIKEFLAKAKGDLVVFPELALTGYEVDFSALNQESVLALLSEVTQVISEDKVVLLGAPWYQEEKIFNTIYRLTRDQIEPLAQKFLLFPGLDDPFSPGLGIRVIELRDVSIGLLVCFELRSPEIARELIKSGVDFLLVFALWPLTRITHWLTLCVARAIENQTYLVGVNGYGYSLMVSPKGEKTENLLDDKPGIWELSLPLEPISLPYPLKTPFFDRKNKLKTLEELKKHIVKRKAKGQKMVFTNGCFDILHAGHVDYLEKARSLGDFLVVGLNSDLSIKKIKGPERPINPQTFRAKVLSGLECVDYIVVFDEETPERLIKELKPDFLVKGADWEENKIVGADFVKSYGGKVVRIKFSYQVSTTNLINQIKQSR
nr:D-glycero-beta-D-manno-heptose 1-phosphate adenylyltransferase [Thermodesulfobacterium sp. TA1]